MILLLFFRHVGAAQAGTESCDRWFKAEGKNRGVVVLTHGMNLSPEAMEPLAKVLSQAGFEVLNAAFTGHCGADNNNYLQVTAAQWEADARRIYDVASARAKADRLPLYVVAYSFSTTIFQSMSQELPFEKYVLLAPAFSTHFWYPLVRSLANWMPSFTYASVNLPGYRMNLRSGMKPLSAFEHFLEKWEKAQNGPAAPAPELWILDPADELISFEGTQMILKTHPQWKLFQVSTAQSTLPKSYHHLIIDEPALGTPEWKRMTDAIVEFLR